MAALREAKDIGSFDMALKQSMPIVVEFYTPSCVFCKKVEPMLAAVGEELKGRLATIKVDAAAQLELAAKYDVRGVPTLIVFKEGKVMDRKTGFMTAAMLRDWVRPHLP